MGRVVFSIARRDLLGYLAAPKAGVVFMLFLLFMGAFFGRFVEMFNAMYANQGMQPGAELPSIEDLFRALFMNLHFILLLVIPALTMGSFADELRMHSIKLLQTSPVKSVEIVLGKFLALAGILALMLLASGVMPWFLFAHGTPDIRVVLTAYLGVFLLMMSQLAFGMWVSALTSSQFFAFILTIFGLFLLLIINFLAPNDAGATGLSAFASYIAASTHLEPFLKGVISVKGVTYFVCTIVFFLFFTNVVFDSHRWR